MPLIAQTPYNSGFIERHGTYRRYINVLDRKETAVQRQIRRAGLGSYEPAFHAALLALCEVTPAPLVFVDVGAHIGIYSAVVASVFAQSNPCIVAFEPTPHTACLARRLRDVNRLGYMICENAVSDTRGTVDLFISPKAETSNSLDKTFRKSDEAVRVPMTTIDAFCKDGALRPTIIKVDVETLEHAVLRGGLETIKSNRPFITCEILPHVDRELMGAMMCAVEHLGYRFYQVHERTTDWVAVSANEAMSHTSSKARDWIFSPVELGPTYHASREGWFDAMGGCGKEKNVLIDGGAPMPVELFAEW